MVPQNWNKWNAIVTWIQDYSLMHCPYLCLFLMDQYTMNENSHEKWKTVKWKISVVDHTEDNHTNNYSSTSNARPAVIFGVVFLQLLLCHIDKVTF